MKKNHNKTQTQPNNAMVGKRLIPVKTKAGKKAGRLRYEGRGHPKKMIKIKKK